MYFRNVKPLLFALAVLPLITAQADTKLFLLAGQSNMAGSGALSDLTEEQKQLPDNVTVYQQGKPFDITSREKFGPEVALAHALAERYPEDEILLVKFAVGGTSLYFDWAQEKTDERYQNAIQWELDKGRTPKLKFTPGQTESLYHGAVGQARRVLRENPEATLQGIFWMQGEQDCRIQQGADNYAALLVELAAAFRRDLDAPEAPFVYGVINCTDKFYPLVDTVKAEQVKAVELIPNAAVVPTEDLEMKDGAHFKSASYLILGERFAEAYETLAKAK